MERMCIEACEGMLLNMPVTYTHSHAFILFIYNVPAQT
jgi:hypothetical protein